MISKEFLILNKSKYFNVDEEFFKYFLAGFIEGDGSLGVSIKNHSDLKFGFSLDPEFSIYQHVSGLLLLNAAKKYFRSGRIYKKFGESDVYVFRINNKYVLKEKVIPFFRKYVIPYSCKYVFFDKFCFVIESLCEKKHEELEFFLFLLKEVYDLNPYSKGKDRKFSYEEIREIILRDYMSKK